MEPNGQPGVSLSAAHPDRAPQVTRSFTGLLSAITARPTRRSFDLDSGAILATSGAAGPSVIQIRQQDLLSEAIVRTVVATIHIAAPALASGAVVTIHEDRSRIRVLPLHRSTHAD